MRCLFALASALAIASLTACAAKPIVPKPDPALRERQEAARRTLELEQRLVEAAEREAQLRRELEAARRAAEPAGDVALSESLKGKGVSVKRRGRDSVIQVPSEIFFASGKSEVTADGARVLAEVAEAIKALGSTGLIRVEGHADSDPVRKSKHHCNWDLSFERAHAVVHQLEKAGIDPRRLVAECHGEHRPLDPSDKARNRRVEIVLTRQ